MSSPAFAACRKVSRAFGEIGRPAVRSSRAPSRRDCRARRDGSWPRRARTAPWRRLGPSARRPRPSSSSDAELVGRLRIAEIAGQPIPARGLEFVAADRGAVVVDCADQRHRRGVLRIVVETSLGLLEREEEIAALIGAEGEIRRLSVGARRQRRRRLAAASRSGPEGWPGCASEVRRRADSARAAAHERKRKRECESETRAVHGASAAFCRERGSGRAGRPRAGEGASQIALVERDEIGAGAGERGPPPRSIRRRRRRASRRFPPTSRPARGAVRAPSAGAAPRGSPNMT